MSRDLLKKLSAILDRGQKIRILGLMVLILIGGLLETASASLILPLVSAILDEEKFAKNRYVMQIRELLGIESVRTFTLCKLFFIKNGTN